MTKKNKTSQTTDPAIAVEPVLPAVLGKSVDRVHKCYNYAKYPEEWKAQYNMLLPDGITCKQCVHCNKCCTIFGQKETDTKCQFHPSRFFLV